MIECEFCGAQPKSHNVNGGHFECGSVALFDFPDFNGQSVYCKGWAAAIDYERKRLLAGVGAIGRSMPDDYTDH